MIRPLSINRLTSLFVLLGGANAFTVSPVNRIDGGRISVTELRADTVSTIEEVATGVDLDQKEMVKVFGRLAEKYIMLDSSGGMCCYSACSDCEFRLPGGGYIMAEQSASRPKWIPSYDERSFESGKEHTSKWSTEVFGDESVIAKEGFVQAVKNMQYNPPLGGPYVSKSKAEFNDDLTLNVVFDKLANGKDKLSKIRFSRTIKQMANGEEGLTWAAFRAALTGE